MQDVTSERISGLGSAVDGVLTDPGPQLVGAVATGEDIGTSVAFEGVVAAPSGELVGALPAGDHVGPVVTGQAVVPAGAEDVLDAHDPAGCPVEQPATVESDSHAVVEIRVVDAIGPVTAVEVVRTTAGEQDASPPNPRR